MLDHLVYVVPDLQEAIAEFTARGYPPAPGGRHLSHGTCNALLRLGSNSYLELLAVDPATDIAPPRWMGVDLIRGSAISRWAVHAGAKRVEAAMQGGSRLLADGQILRWRLTDPGTSPAVNVVPFLIEWSSEGSHPSSTLPDLGLELVNLRLRHPEPGDVNVRLADLGLTNRATRGSAPKIEAEFRGPRGSFTL